MKIIYLFEQLKLIISRSFSGKIVDFAGWLLPVQYREAIAASHQHTRSHASLFDVGHMLQTRVLGKDSGEFLESLTTVDLKALPQGGAGLTVFTNDNGGIMDDLIISKDKEDQYFVVSNAGRRNEDMEIMNKQLVRVKFFLWYVQRFITYNVKNRH